MEYNISRRDFVKGLSYSLFSLELVVDPTKITFGKGEESENYSLKKLEYLLNPPKEESYQVSGKTIKLKLDNNYFVMSTPVAATKKERDIKSSDLFKIISCNQERPPKLISAGTIIGNNLYLIFRDYLKDEENKKRLEEATKKDMLPCIYPSWVYNDLKIIPTNRVSVKRVSVKPKSKEKEKLVLSFAKKMG